MESIKAASKICEKIFKEAETEAFFKSLETDFDYQKECFSALLSSNDVSKDDLTEMEFLNSVRDARLRLEARVLRLEIQSRQQKLAVKEFECQQALDAQKLSSEVPVFLKLARDNAERQKRTLVTEVKRSRIDMKLARCRSRLEKFEALAPTQADLDVVNQIRVRVKRSMSHLTRLMHLEGFATAEAMLAATEATGKEADRFEHELRQLRLKIAALEERLLVAGKPLGCK